MSTKAIRDALRMAVDRRGFGDAEDEMKAMAAAEAALDAIEKAAADMTRLCVGEFAYLIEDRLYDGDASATANARRRADPTVKAFSDGCALLAFIAKEVKQ
jgi:hypothetical protein